MRALRFVQKSWNLFRQYTASKTRRQKRTRLELRPLEDRCVPALTTGTITGTAFLDTNANGRFDGGELALSGQKITLQGRTVQGKVFSLQNGNAIVATTRADGTFRFFNTPQGTYGLTSPPIAGLTGLPATTGLFRIVAGGVVHHNLGYKGVDPNNLSLRPFLTSTTPILPVGAPGTGNAQVTPRPNNSPFIAHAFANVTINTPGTAAPTVDLAGKFDDVDITNTRVQIVTSQGNIDIDLSDRLTPQTVANFLDYVNANRYDSTFFHRLGSLSGTSNPREVLQGGGFQFIRSGSTTTLPALANLFPTVANEFLRPNVAGTIAMAKLGGDPNSATSQFFFNLTDNTDELGAGNNGGFTVFGKVTDAGMAVLARIAALNVSNQSAVNGAFGNLPLSATANTTSFPTNVLASDLAFISDVRITKKSNDALTYQILSAPTDLVTASISNHRLTLQSKGKAGTGKIVLLARDSTGAGTIATFNVTVENKAPTIGSVSFNTPKPQSSTKLTATVNNAADANGDPIKYTYVWKVDGVVKQTTPNVTALNDTFDLGVAGNGDPGQVVSVEVTPTDGTANGTAATVSATVADNDAPRIGSVTLSPTKPLSGSTVTATVNNPSDANGDAIKYTYVWKVDGVVKKTTTLVDAVTDTFDLSVAGNGDDGQLVSVEVTPNDGMADGPVFAANAAVNSAPTIGSVTLTPSSATAPTTSQTLTATVVGATDLDGDSIRFTYVWKVDGVVKKTTTNSTSTTDTFDLSVAGNGDKGQVVTVEVEPNDTLASGAKVTQTTTVVNAAPSVLVSLDNNAPMTNDTIRARVTNISDADGDPVTFTFVWKVNGTVVKTTSNSTTPNDTLDLSEVGNGNKGDTVVVEVTASDGTTSSAVVSATGTVGNTPPAVASVDLDNLTPTTTSTVTATAAAPTDVDTGDTVMLTYVWTRSGSNTTVRTETTASLTDSLDLSTIADLAVGETLIVTVTPNDGTANGTAVTKSATITA